MQVRSTSLDDIGDILALYRKVASNPGGLARLANEVGEDYVRGFLSKSLADGIALVAVLDSSKIIGEIHAYSPGLYCFSHVLSDLTIAVDPETQGLGVGRVLFESFMQRAIDDHPDILRVELIVRESNVKAIRFYETLGFSVEGKLVSRIRNIDSSLESDIPMSWVRA